MSDQSAGRQLPTRVSTACDRCRRHKSRCDPYRPCSLCVRAKVDCPLSNDSTTGRAVKRRRIHRSQKVSEQATLQQTEESQRIAATDVTRDASRQPSVAEGEESSTAHDELSGRPSILEGEADSAMGIAHRIYQLGSQPTLERTTSAIPGGDVYGKKTGTRLDRTRRRPIPSILGYSLPPVTMMRMFLEEYFDAVHWFSLVIYEPTFRTKFELIQDDLAYPSQKGFLLLLSTVLGMGAWYKSHRCGNDPDFPGEDWHAWSLSLMKGAGSQLTELMDQTSISSVQACILLGSYYVYHGKPNLSFALLGATIRTAQAIGLHRQPLRGDTASIEERKRVWWTIYTWDRFASVTYGRPLGINEKDCNITQPTDIAESPHFRENASTGSDIPIYYSSYQRELNKLYLIASPIIEVVFGMRAIESSEKSAGPQYMKQVMDVTEQVWAWRRRLPGHLLFDLLSDCELNQSQASKVYRLQALSLQLTFDSLLIIFHRPLLTQQIDHLMRNQPENCRVSTQSPSGLSNIASSPLFVTNATSPLTRSQASSTEQWWDAALRTSRVTEMPQLAQLATDSHLIAFLAINLFNSAIVMAVLALSEPLSNRAQEVKRTITRIFRLQELLGKKTQLSMQSNVVLKDVIQMLLRREADAMLGDSTSAQLETPLMSVEETLRLSIQMPLGKTNYQENRQPQVTTERAMRLNESLASVQRVFPAGFDTILSSNTTCDQEWRESNLMDQTADGNSDDWSRIDVQNIGTNSGADWGDNMGIDMSSNGLYWFWDSMWS